MKFFYTLVLTTGLALNSLAQNAVNFNVKDCAGVQHELFEDLKGDKVLVLVWVMPCATCINGALTAQTEVQQALASSPGKVLFFLADDYGTTSCQTLNSWCQQNGITDATIFSNAGIKMTDYGSNGMPKVVVIGSTLKVYYNANDQHISGQGISDGIAQALAENLLVNLSQIPKSAGDVIVFPQPVSQHQPLQLWSRAETLQISITDALGRVVFSNFSRSENGCHQLQIHNSGLQPGVYQLLAEHGRQVIRKKVIIE